MPTSPSDSRPRLPFLVTYSALGILLRGKPYGTVTRLSKASLSRAIQIATAARQTAGELAEGTRTLTKRGVAAERALRVNDPAKADAAAAEFERLVELTHGPAARSGPRASVRARAKANGPAAAADVKYRLVAQWSPQFRRWHAALKRARTPLFVNYLDGLDVNSTDAHVYDAAISAARAEGVKLVKGSTVAYRVERPVKGARAAR